MREKEDAEDGDGGFSFKTLGKKTGDKRIVCVEGITLKNKA